ncbi:Cupin domain-containing protein [Frankineae bacterium MT45]|nr:Cupin domain-containing protein [Frankineae bacterium MT45]
MHSRVQYDALMDASTIALAAAIGARVKAERQTRRWTLDQLAAAAGVSRRMLVNVEQGTVNPSVGTLLRISDALGVGLPALVEPPASTPLRVVRAGQGATLWTSEAGGRGVLVAGTEPPDVVELWDWCLPSGDHYVSEPHSAGTRELAHVLEGTLTISVAGVSVQLAVGDAITFRGDLDHSYTNSGPVAARFSLAVFEPGVGVARRVEGASEATPSNHKTATLYEQES